MKTLKPDQPPNRRYRQSLVNPSAGKGNCRIDPNVTFNAPLTCLHALMRRFVLRKDDYELLSLIGQQVFERECGISRIDEHAHL